ncbi:MAG: HDOD domain-containing protein [Syntrophobacteraceae bacterium]
MDLKGLDYWTDRLCRENMPVFAHAVQRVAGVASKESTTFSELAWTIMHDPALTARVLKMSNSIYYNPSSRPITTVSRGVIRLGFDTVTAICLTASFLETILPKLNRRRVALEVARAFHAAVQAKTLAGKCRLIQAEEVFVAALLSRIGHIGFWCFASEIGEKLEKSLEDSDKPESMVEMQVLGFRLDQLTMRLAREWKLGGLLESVMARGGLVDAKSESVRLGCSLARCAEKGWDCSEPRKVVQKIGAFLKVPEWEAYRTVHCAAQDAVEMTASLGAQNSSCLIPVPPEPVQVLNEPAAVRIEYPKTDLQMQLSSLRELSSVVSSGAGTLNSVLSILLKGIYQGIGMDRVMLALLTPDSRNIKGKYGLGWSEDQIENFRIGLSPIKPTNIISHVIQHQKTIWVNEDPEPEIFALLTREISNLIGNGPFFIMPICIKGKVVGVIYADRTPSGRDLESESFESFAFFGQQANMSLASLR